MSDQPTGAQPATDANATTVTPEAPAQPTSTPAAPPTAPAPAEAEKSPSKVKKIVSALVIVAAVLAVKFGLGYVLSDKPVADSLSAGQCVTKTEDSRIEKVDCGDSKADFTVLGIQLDTTEGAAESVCAPYKDTTSTYFESREGETKGNLVCLSDLK